LYLFPDSYEFYKSESLLYEGKLLSPTERCPLILEALWLFRMKRKTMEKV